MLNVAVDTSAASLLTQLQEAAVAGTLISGYDVAQSDVEVAGALTGQIWSIELLIFSHLTLTFRRRRSGGFRFEQRK